MKLDDSWLVVAFFGSLVLILLFSTGCSGLEPLLEEIPDVELPGVPELPSTGDVVSSFNVSEEDLLLGNFNVQIFGTSKVSKPEVMSVLTSVISEYDLLSFQEIRDSSESAFPALMEGLPEHDFIISERLGRSTSKEQYAFIYRKDKLTPRTSFVYQDSQDVFEREPFVAEFVTPSGFDFVLIQVHTKPTDAESEIEALGGVLEEMQLFFVGETDFVILGDLNADCDYYSGGSLEELTWLIPDEFDTTTKSTDCAYDRIIVSDSLADNVESVGVDRFDLNYGLSYEETIDVSDHYPIYTIIGGED